MLVAKFSAYNLSLHTVGKFESADTKVTRDEARDEIAITVMTVFCCMLFRASNPFPFLA